MRSFATARRLAAHWLVDFPPLYIATIALVAGDALGNAGVYIPLAVAIAIALIATAAYLTAHPAAGIALAFIAIAAAATVPVTGLLEPPRGPHTLYRFADDSKVTIEGVLVREPEHADGGRTYLQLRVERAGAAVATPVPARTRAATGAAVPVTSRTGTEGTAPVSVMPGPARTRAELTAKRPRVVVRITPTRWRTWTGREWHPRYR